MAVCNTSVHCSPGCCSVAEIYSTPPTREDANAMVLYRCGDEHLCLTVQTHARQWLQYIEQQIMLGNPNYEDSEAAHNSIGSCHCNRQDIGTNTNKRKQHVWPVQHSRILTIQLRMFTAVSTSGWQCILKMSLERNLFSSTQVPTHGMKLTVKTTAQCVLTTVKVLSS